MSKKKQLIWLAVILVAVLLVCAVVGAVTGHKKVGGGASGLATSSTQSTEPTTPVQTTDPAADPTSTPRQNAAATISDGQWKIGVEKAAGQYKTAGPVASLIPNCYWQKTTTPDAQPGDAGWVSNQIEPGQAYVTLKAGQFFQTRGCQAWVKQ